ncbi:MAG TPA: methionine synthase [Terriglobia bacterium]|jgi:5-methyltetrahydropteroyltriglutamate--homocysteine methyltransferase
MSIDYRADHVGSLLRPAELLEAHAAEPHNSEKLRELEDRHISRVLAKQKELGLEIFADGELRRRNFMAGMTDTVEGFDLNTSVTRTWQAGNAAGTDSRASANPLGVVNAKVRALRPLTGHELPYMKQHCPGAIKMTLPSATQFPAIAYRDGVTDKVYPNRSALLWDLVEIVKTEMARLADEGVNYIQIDAPRYSYYMDPKWREWIRTEMNADPDAMFEESLRADNACLAAARRPGVTLAIHLCRGNNRSHWYAQGGYDAVAEKLFGTLDVDRFLLEYDDERSGSFEPLRFVPKGKVAVLGLVSSKLAGLEDQSSIVRRIEEAARYMPLDGLALSPQCGFASMMEGNLMNEEQQWAKLKLVVETARAVWN